MSPPRLPTVAASVDISTVLVAGCVRVVVGHVVGHVTVGHVGASVGGAVGLAVVAVVGQVGGVVLMSSGHFLPAG